MLVVALIERAEIVQYALLLFGTLCLCAQTFQWQNLCLVLSINLKQKHKWPLSGIARRILLEVIRDLARSKHQSQWLSMKSLQHAVQSLIIPGKHSARTADVFQVYKKHSTATIVFVSFSHSMSSLAAGGDGAQGTNNLYPPAIGARCIFFAWQVFAEMTL